jgi:hypothetical protein
MESIPAAELWRTTGDDAYNRYFHQNYAEYLPTLRAPEPESWRVVAPMGLWAYALASRPGADTRAAADPANYAYLQWKRQPGDTCPLEAAVRVGDRWYTSAWGRADLAFRGADAESTAVKLPPGTSGEAIAAIAVRARLLDQA